PLTLTRENVASQVKLGGTKVTRIVDDRLGSQCLQQFVILPDTRPLVVDMQRRHDTVGDDAGTKPAWSAGDLAVEDQAHLAWPTDVQVLADHLFEKDPPGHRPIEHLGEGERTRPAGSTAGSDSRRRDRVRGTDVAIGAATCAAGPDPSTSPNVLPTPR